MFSPFAFRFSHHERSGTPPDTLGGGWVNQSLCPRRTPQGILGQLSHLACSACSAITGEISARSWTHEKIVCSLQGFAQCVYLRSALVQQLMVFKQLPIAPLHGGQKSVLHLLDFLRNQCTPSCQVNSDCAHVCLSLAFCPLGLLELPITTAPIPFLYRANGKKPIRPVSIYRHRHRVDDRAAVIVYRLDSHSSLGHSDNHNPLESSPVVSVADEVGLTFDWRFHAQTSPQSASIRAWWA
jgi:hypothetical protein